jgi:signal peptidase I
LGSARNRTAAEVDAAVATGAVPVASLTAPPRQPPRTVPPPGSSPAPRRPEEENGGRPTSPVESQTIDPRADATSLLVPGTGRSAPTRPDQAPGPVGQPDALTSGPATGELGRPVDAPDGAGTKGKPKRGRRRKNNFWRELPILVGVALLLTFLIQTFVVRVYEIPSGSMEKTLHGCSGCSNDKVLVDKLSYRFGDPSPGDVVVFLGPPGWQGDSDSEKRSDNPIVAAMQSALSVIGLAPPAEEDFIKRVIAVGGQTVACCDAQNRVTVDGRPLTEPYIYYVPDSLPKEQNRFGPVIVPKGDLWMMGDSRNNSEDSRWPGQGPVPMSYVIGKARFVVLPLHRIRTIPDDNPQEVSLAAGTHPLGPSLALGALGALPITAGGRRLRRGVGRWKAGRRRSGPPGSTGTS